MMGDEDERAARDETVITEINSRLYSASGEMFSEPPELQLPE